jgi:hypothetical protein
MPDRDHPARRAAADVHVGLDRQHEPVRLAVNGQDVHAGHVEQQVGARAPGRARGARRVIHVEAFSSINCLVAVDPEGLDVDHPWTATPATIRPARPRETPKSRIACHADHRSLMFKGLCFVRTMCGHDF